MSKGDSHSWLSIQDASRLLGVHVGTVRAWADSGILPSYRTPGGHRRFSISDIESFIHRLKHTGNSSRPQSENILGQVRHEMLIHPLVHESWFRHLSYEPSDQDRARQRDFGKRLLDCVITFTQEAERRDEMRECGTALARSYGKILKANGLSAGNAARATIHFRQLILKSVLEAKLGSRVGDVEDARLFQDVSAFIDSIFLAMLEEYE